MAIVEVGGDTAIARYIRKPFKREPDIGVSSVNYDQDKLLAQAEDPR